MKKIFILSRNTILLIICILLTLLSSCDDLLSVDDPASRVSNEVVFKDALTATTAVTGMYATMTDAENFASGALNSVTAIAALSADDFTNYWPENVTAIQFNENNIRPDNEQILSLWTTAYQIIYQSNSVIEGLAKSTSIGQSVRDKLLGEALFVRAFCHFYLVNMFGDVPLVTSTDYRYNTNAPRVDVSIVYAQIVEDLLSAQVKMEDNYPSTGRVRPNKQTATALLARVYLYMGDWENAEIQSTDLINDDRYMLESDVNNVFTSNSKEAIWQLRQTRRDINTYEGNYFIVADIPQYYYLTESLIESFESGDVRLDNWINSVAFETETFFYPFKYKIQSGGPGSTPPVPLTELSMIFRLAEQHLIRAEARTQQNKLGEAIDDVDIIRDRANLPLIHDTAPLITKEDLLLAIERERRFELFTEWGHRWFDLKRTDRTTAVLGSFKENWNATDELYPIPEIEFSRNQALDHQNQGY